MTAHVRASMRPRSLAAIVAVWLVLQLGGIFRPGLLDDVDSIYIEVAREMLQRHDYVTPMVDGIRFFDKPPLMYWVAAASMRIFGEHDWAARLPLALGVLALLVSVYALGRRLYAGVSPAGREDRGALYAALAMATAIGPYLYTRFFIPDLLICLWMTLGVHLFLVALDRAATGMETLWPSLGFAAVLALNLLTKGLIGLVFPLGFVIVYLLITRQWRLLPRLHLLLAAITFAVIGLPWHVLAALANPAVTMPPMARAAGLPTQAGWAWFYLYNEHIARFLGQRVPQDYGNTPRWLFWLYAVIWMMPWAAFLPAAIAGMMRDLGHRLAVIVRQREAALTCVIWAAVVMLFFTASHRQEYYSLPALPALALLLGGALAQADVAAAVTEKAVLACHRWVLMPVAVLVAGVCGFFAVTAPQPAPGTDLASLLAQNPEIYNLSLGHLFDLTGAAMGLFRGPLGLVCVGMLVLGPMSYVMRWRGRGLAANLTLAAGMTAVLLAAHEGLARFNPILGSEGLARAIMQEQAMHPEAGDLIVIDGELTSGSTLLFYTRQPVHLLNGRMNGLWFGSFWPDSPKVFEDEASAAKLWSSERRVFLMTPKAADRGRRLSRVGPVRELAAAGGKIVLVNR